MKKLRILFIETVIPITMICQIWWQKNPEKKDMIVR